MQIFLRLVKHSSLVNSVEGGGEWISEGHLYWRLSYGGGHGGRSPGEKGAGGLWENREWEAGFPRWGEAGEIRGKLYAKFCN